MNVGDLIFASVFSAMDEARQAMDKDIEYALRNLVTPPIKGEITKGKIRWRGLRIVYVQVPPKFEQTDKDFKVSLDCGYELWQRDKRIL